MTDRLADLGSIEVPLTRRSDFDEFWQNSLRIAAHQDLNCCLKQVEYPANRIKVYELTYQGFDRTVIHGWLILPQAAETRQVSCLIHYPGFSGHRGYPVDFMHWLALDIAVISVDCREQSGKTGNLAGTSSGHMTNVACKGILDPNEYYYRAVYLDCLKAIDVACLQPGIDPDRIILEGGSQGGGLAIAVAGLDDRPWMVLANVPSLSDLHRRVEGEYGAFASVADYLRRHPSHERQIHTTLSYFDTINLADRICCPVYASVALKDPVCPAECFFAAYNKITAEKEIILYPYNGHEGGGSLQTERQLTYLASQL